MYSIKKAEDDKKWDEIINLSPQNNIFFKSFFLNSFKKNIIKKIIYKGSEPKACIALITDNKKKNIVENDIIIHSGMIFSKDFSNDTASTNIEKYRVTEFFVDYLSKNFRKILFNTAPGIDDIRPFLWLNYGKKKNVFHVYPKYTLFLNLSDFSNELEQNKVFKKMSTLRRRLIREGIRNKNKVIFSKDVDYLIKNYKIYMKAQNAKILKDKFIEMKNLLKNLVNNNKLLVQISYNNDGSEGYILAFAIDDDKSYYLYGCPLSKKVDNYLGTFSFWNMFLKLKEQKIKLVDFEGINSPSRGLFKQSFGGESVMYFEIEVKR